MPTTQVKTVHATAAGPAGTLLPVELSGGGGAPEPTKAQLKAALAARTGIPAEHQKLLLGAFSQIVVGDKRVMKFGSCGMTEGFGLVREAALQGVKPHIPPATANRADNSGNWTAGDRD